MGPPQSRYHFVIPAKAGIHAFRLLLLSYDDLKQEHAFELNKNKYVSAEAKPIQSNSESRMDPEQAKAIEQLLAAFGTIDFDPTYDYKAQRMRDLKRIPIWADGEPSFEFFDSIFSRMTTPTPSLIPYGAPIDLATAQRIAAAAQKEAEANNWPVVISIVDSGGNLVLLHRMDVAQLASLAISQNKALTSVRMKRPTKLLEDGVTAGGAGLRILALEGVIPMEGGLPILVDGKVIGAIGVSGVTSAQDGQIAAAGLKALED